MRFASFGTPGYFPESTTMPTQYGTCHLGSSKAVIERECIGLDVCQIVVSAELFGADTYDMCKPERILTEVICS